MMGCRDDATKVHRVYFTSCPWRVWVLYPRRMKIWPLWKMSLEASPRPSPEGKRRNHSKFKRACSFGLACAFRRGRALQGFTSSALLHNTVALPIPNAFEKNCIFYEYCLQNSFFKRKINLKVVYIKKY